MDGDLCIGQQAAGCVLLGSERTCAHRGGPGEVDGSLRDFFLRSLIGEKEERGLGSPDDERAEDGRFPGMATRW